MHYELQVPILGNAVIQYTRPNGKVGWVKNVRNGVTLAGCDWLLETVFRGGPQSLTIYAGLINQASFSAAVDTDTHPSHPGWTEWSSLLSATRPQWVAPPANGGLLGTTVAPHFDITADGFIRGVFLANIAAVGSIAAGVLYNTAIAVTPLAVENGGSIDVYFAVRLGE